MRTEREIRKIVYKFVYLYYSLVMYAQRINLEFVSMEIIDCKAVNCVLFTPPATNNENYHLMAIVHTYLWLKITMNLYQLLFLLENENDDGFSEMQNWFGKSPFKYYYHLISVYHFYLQMFAKTSQIKRTKIVLFC